MLNRVSITIVLLILSGIVEASDIRKGSTLIIGHRGAAGHAPENTLTSIKLAMELGANTIEIDLRQTKDGVPVAIHDSDVDRTTDGCGSVYDFTFDEIQKLDAGSWFDEKYAGEKIPSLQEVIEVISDTTLLIIEFKGGLGTYDNIEQHTLKIIHEANLSNRVILKSFDPNQLDSLKTLNNNIPLLYVYAVRIPWLHMIIDTGISFGSVFDLDVEYLQPHIWFLSKSFVEDAQKNQFRIIAWGVNDTDDIKETINFGVDGIETDYPDRVYKLIND